MHHRRLAALALALACLPLGSCSTINTIKFLYGQPCVFDDASSDWSNRTGLRPALAPVAFPVAVVADVATLPIQVIFGVWPFWGDASLHMNPNK